MAPTRPSHSAISDIDAGERLYKSRSMTKLSRIFDVQYGYFCATIVQMRGSVPGVRPCPLSTGDERRADGSIHRAQQRSHGRIFGHSTLLLLRKLSISFDIQYATFPSPNLIIRLFSLTQCYRTATSSIASHNALPFPPSRRYQRRSDLTHPSLRSEQIELRRCIPGILNLEPNTQTIKIGANSGRKG